MLHGSANAAADQRKHGLPSVKSRLLSAESISVSLTGISADQRVDVNRKHVNHVERLTEIAREQISHQTAITPCHFLTVGDLCKTTTGDCLAISDDLTIGRESVFLSLSPPPPLP